MTEDILKRVKAWRKQMTRGHPQTREGLAEADDINRTKQHMKTAAAQTLVRLPF